MASLAGGLEEMKNSLANQTGAELGSTVAGPQSYPLVSGKQTIKKKFPSFQMFGYHSNPSQSACDQPLQFISIANDSEHNWSYMCKTLTTVCTTNRQHFQSPEC